MTVLQREVSQKGESKYHWLIHLCEIFKKMVQMNLVLGQDRDIDIEN